MQSNVPANQRKEGTEATCRYDLINSIREQILYRHGKLQP